MTANIPTFNRWLASQINRDDPIGDLARDCKDDKRWFSPQANPSLRDIFLYLSPYGVSVYNRVGETLIEAYREWQSRGGRYRPKDKPFGKRKQKRAGYPRDLDPVTPRLRFLIFKRDNYRCQLCGRNAQQGITLEIDHKIPRSKGGKSTKENLWVLCFTCNRGKHNDSL
jgi:hypothetical protein